MTNEKLVILAKDGDISAIESLYTNNRGLIYLQIAPFLSYGYDEEDIMQEAYFAVLKAINAYKSDSGLKFTSYLRNAVRWHISRMVVQDKNRKDICVLDEPISEESEHTRAEFIIDENAEFEESTIYNADMSNLIGIVKNALSDRRNGELKYNILIDRYLYGLTLKAVGDKYGLHIPRIRDLEKEAFKDLRNPRNKKMQHYLEYIAERSIFHSGLQEFKNTHTSGVEWAVMKLD